MLVRVCVRKAGRQEGCLHSPRPAASLVTLEKSMTLATGRSPLKEHQTLCLRLHHNTTTQGITSFLDPMEIKLKTVLGVP